MIVISNLIIITISVSIGISIVINMISSSSSSSSSSSIRPPFLGTPLVPSRYKQSEMFVCWLVFVLFVLCVKTRSMVLRALKRAHQEVAVVHDYYYYYYHHHYHYY